MQFRDSLKPTASSSSAAARSSKPAASPSKPTASSSKPAPPSLQPSGPSSSRGAALKKPLAAAEATKPSHVFYTLLIKNLERFIQLFRFAFTSANYSLQPRTINNDTKSVEEDPLLTHNPGSILLKFLQIANAALNEQVKPPFNFDDLATINEFIKNTKAQFFVDNATTAAQLILKQTHDSMSAIVNTICAVILDDLEKPAIHFGGNFGYQNLEIKGVITLLEKLVVSDSKDLPSGEILWRVILAMNRNNGAELVKNNADLIARIRCLFSFYTYDPFKDYPNLSMMAIEHPWLLAFFTSRQLTEFLITCPQESIDALNRKQNLQSKTTPYTEVVYDVGKSLFSKPQEATNGMMVFPTLSPQEKNKRVLVNFLVDPRVAVYTGQVIKEVLTGSQNNGTFSLRQFIMTIGGFPQEFILFLDPSTLIDLFLEFDDQATVKHKDLLATMEAVINAETARKHIKNSLLLARVEAALKRDINPRVYIKPSTNSTNLLDADKESTNSIYLLDAEAVRVFIEFAWLLTRIETDLERGIDAQLYFNSKQQIPYLLYELVKRDALLKMPLPRLAAIFKAIRPDLILETLQLLDPENDSTCCIVIGKAQEKYLVDKSNKDSLLQFVQILLADEFLSLRQCWVQDQRAEQLIIQYPFLLKGLSYNTINAYMRKLDPEKRQALIANAINCFENKFNLFISCPILLSYLSPEDLIRLAHLNNDINRLLVGNFKYKDIDRLPAASASSSASSAANVLPVVSALPAANNGISVASVLPVGSALPHEVILDFIRKNHFAKLAAAIPELNGVFTAEYFKTVNPELLDEQLLLAIISDDTTKLALKRNPTILRYFNPDVLETCAMRSSFLRQVLRQFDLIELILANFDDLFDRNFDLLKSMISYLYLNPESLSIYNNFLAKSKSSRAENQNTNNTVPVIAVDEQRFTAIAPYTNTKEFPEHPTIEDLEAVLACKESDSDRVASDPKVFLADPIVFLIESMIRAYPKWLNRFIQSPGFYPILIKYCSQFISHNMDSSDNKIPTLYQRVALFVKAGEYSRAINYLKELITSGVLFIPTDKTKTSALHLLLVCADHVMKTEPSKALEHYILIAGELVSVEDNKIASFKITDRVKNTIQAKLVMTVEFARKALLLVQNDQMPEDRRLHLMSLLNKLLQKIPYNETSTILFLETNALVKLRLGHLHFKNAEFERGLQVRRLKPQRDQELLRDIKRVEKAERKRQEAEESLLKQERELKEKESEEQAKREEEEAKQKRLQEEQELQKQQERERVKKLEGELAQYMQELESLEQRQKEQSGKHREEEEKRKAKEAEETRLRQDQARKLEEERNRLQKEAEDERVSNLEEISRLRQALERERQETQREKERADEAICVEQTRQRQEEELKKREEEQREKRRVEELRRQKEEAIKKERLQEEKKLQKQLEEERVKNLEKEVTRLRLKISEKQQQETQREEERTEEIRLKEERESKKREDDQREKERVKKLEVELGRLTRDLELRKQQDEQRERERAEEVERKKKETEETRQREELEFKQHEEEQHKKKHAEEAKRREDKAEQERLQREQALQKQLEEEQREKERKEKAESEQRETELLLLALQQEINESEASTIKEEEEKRKAAEQERIRQLEEEKRRIEEQKNARKQEEEIRRQQKETVGTAEEAARLNRVADLKKKFEGQVDNGGKDRVVSPGAAVSTARGAQSPAALRSQNALPPQAATAPALASASTATATAIAIATGQTHDRRKEEPASPNEKRATTELRENAGVTVNVMIQAPEPSSEGGELPPEIKSTVVLEHIGRGEAARNDNPPSEQAVLPALTRLEKMAEEQVVVDAKEREIKIKERLASLAEQAENEIDNELRDARRRPGNARRRPGAYDSDYQPDSPQGGVTLNPEEFVNFVIEIDERAKSAASTPRGTETPTDAPQSPLPADGEMEPGTSESAVRLLHGHGPLQRTTSTASYHHQRLAHPRERAGESSSTAALLLSPTSTRGGQPPAGTSSSPRELLPTASASSPRGQANAGSPRKGFSAKSILASVSNLPSVFLGSKKTGTTPPVSPGSAERVATNLQETKRLETDMRDSESGKSPKSEKEKKGKQKDEQKDKKHKKDKADKKEKKGKTDKKGNADQQESSSTLPSPPSSPHAKR